MVNTFQEEDCVFQLVQLQTTSKSTHPTKRYIANRSVTIYCIFPNLIKIETHCDRKDFAFLQGSYLVYLTGANLGQTKQCFAIEEQVTSRWIANYSAIHRVQSISRKAFNYWFNPFWLIIFAIKENYSYNTIKRNKQNPLLLITTSPYES